MALGEPLNSAAQAVTLSGGNILFDGAAVNGHKTLADAGAADAAEHHIELRGAEGWELLRITYSSGSPDSAPRPAPLASSNGGSAVSFSGAVEAFYVVPGVKTELAELVGFGAGAYEGFAGNPYALSFDGADDYVSDIGAVSDYSFIQNTAVFTIEAWIKLDNPSADKLNGIAGNAGGSASKGFFFGFENRSSQSSPRKIVFKVFRGESGVPVFNAATPNDIITDTDWHFVVVYADGVDVNFFIDDTFYASVSVGTLSSGDSSDVLALAAITNSGSYQFAGDIDEVRIWNTTRKQQQILDNMNSALNGNETGLVGYWKFDEGVGTTAGDSTANNNDGTINGASWVPDIPGSYALDFNGTNSYIDINIGSVGPTLTFELWAKHSSAESSSYVYLFDQTNRSFIVEWSAANGQLGFYDGSHNSIGANPSDGKWHHLAWVFDSAAGVCEIFVDGASIGSAAYSGAQDTARSLFSDFDLTAQFFGGFATDVRLWNTARTQQQILDNMNRALNGNETGLVAYWKLDEGTGTTAGDSTANNNDGTINGATWVQGFVADPLHRAGQSGSINAALDTVTLDGSALGGHVTFDAAGAVDSIEYPLQVAQGTNWEYRRGTFSAGTPGALALGAVLASSNGDSAVAFDDQQAVRVTCAIPGVQSELTALFQ